MTLILVVDDDPIILEMFDSLLYEEGYGVVCALHGREALTVINYTRPDLILTDVKLPFMDGIQLSRHLRSDPQTAHIPIIFMSSTAENRVPPDSQYNGFLRKPFTLATALKAINQLVQPSF